MNDKNRLIYVSAGFLLSKQIAESGGKDMSEDVKRMGRELAYQGTVLKVYKDHMKFSNGNTEDWDLSIMTERQQLFRLWMMVRY